MPLQLQGVHKYKREEGTNRMVLVEKHPYVRLVKKGEPPVIVQDGHFYADGGPEYTKESLPSWVIPELRNRTDEGLRNIGLRPEDYRKVKKPGKKEAPKIEEAPVQPLNEPPDLDQQVIDALNKFNSAEDAHWTKSGLPDLNALKEALGRRVTRGKVNELMPDLTRPPHGD
jgi:hypothetical protein